MKFGAEHRKNQKILFLVEIRGGRKKATAAALFFLSRSQKRH